jgi:hypothetical protein
MALPTTTLVVPVPQAEPAVGALRQRYDVWARRGFPAHVTVLGPFLPLERIDDGVLARLQDMIARYAQADFALASIRVVLGAVLLVPDRVDYFASLGKTLVREWPEARSRRPSTWFVGPHLTVARGFGPITTLRVRRELAPLLPIAARASEVALVTLAERAETVARFELGAV